MDEEDDDVQDICRSKISRFRKKFRSAPDQSFVIGGEDVNLNFLLNISVLYFLINNRFCYLSVVFSLSGLYIK